jgi:D-3-phosphoglycerate dehydrogenase
MSKYKVVVCDHIHNDGMDILRNHNEIELIDACKFDKEKKLQSLNNAQGAITRSSTDVDDDFLQEGKSLKAIVRAGVGVDNVDINSCSKAGIVVMNVPTSNTIAAVELTMTHLLACMRNFVNCNNELKSNIWNRENWYGTELKDKKIGVIGFGNIGSRVAIRAKGFEMDVIAYDPYIPASKVTSLDMTYTSDFDDILDCDIITIHTPKNNETKNMIAKAQIDKMKDNAILINCARGGLVNEDDLYNALKSKKIAMAGIDVFDKEPANHHRFLELENTTITPHVGANTIESQRRVAIAAANQIINAVRGASYVDALNLPIKDEENNEEVKPYFALAQKLGFMASMLSHGNIQSIKLNAFGIINKYDKALLTFTTVGVMQHISENVNYVNAEHIAKEKDIKLEHIAKEKEGTFINKITIDLICDNKRICISGSIFDNVLERIVSINGFELDVNPKGNMILFKNSDVSGVVSQVSTILAEYNINISDLRMGRNDKKEALAVIITDEKISSVIIEKLSKIKACLSIDYIQL